MRSPWQLIKSLTSRRKVEEASELVNEAVPTSDPREQEVAQDLTLQAGPNAAPDSILAIPVDDNQPNSAEAETTESDPIVRTDPSLSEHVSNEAPEPHARPSPAAPVRQAIERQPIVSASAGGPNEHYAHAIPEQIVATETTVVKRAPKRQEAAKKTILEETIELDREINELRAQLSAKLLQQNKQLRRMLERYNDR
ncbi:MAG TPA: hypothetical protein VGC14_19365 [Rhizobium sp.]